LDKLKETEKYPRFKPSGDLKKDFDELVKYVNRTKNWIEDLYSELTKRTNWILKLVADNHYEIISPANTGIGQDGNVRWAFDSNYDLVLQLRISGTWTTIEKTTLS